LTVDIIEQITGVLKLSVDENALFTNFIDQTIFLLLLVDIIIFIVSMILFDKIVKNMLQPIEYLSNVQKRFAENISHELRTPLSIMNMHGEILLNKITKAKKDPSSLDLNAVEGGVITIHDEIFGITNLIDDLLFEARIKYSEDKVVNINIKSLKDIFEKIIKDQENLKNNDVIVSIEDNIEEIFLNKSFKTNKIHFERVINNLISNSFKFTSKGSVKILLSNYRRNKKDYLRIVLEDTGIGIKKEDLEKVGERFFRGKNVENYISGTGIGLAIVSDLAKNYD
jgi:hypothetical protein